ncbi:unnamed protein product, partial [Cuscuta epithymum]
MVASKWKVFNCLWVIALALGIIGVLCGIIAAVIGRRYRIQVPEDVALQCKRPGWAVVPALASHMLSAIIAVLLRASVPVASKCVRTRWVIARLQIEHWKNESYIHQSNYTEKVFKRFYMDKAHPLTSPMVVQSLNIHDDPFRPREDNGEILRPEVPYM